MTSMNHCLKCDCLDLVSTSPHDDESLHESRTSFLPLPERSSFSDPAFASNKQLPLHRWTPWIAGFSSSFVNSVLSKNLPENGVVLDPFCGVGTTLVEAILHGHDAFGFEINPYAALASKTKTHAYTVEHSLIANQIQMFNLFYRESMKSNYKPFSEIPKGFKTRSHFYSTNVLHKVLVVQDYISSINDPKVKDLFRIAFASTMVQYSNYSYEPSLGRRISAGKSEIDDYPVEVAIIDKLTEIMDDVRWFRKKMNGFTVQHHVYNSSFFDCQKFIEQASIDIIITSPPYLNNYHYNRNTRPQLYWLGLVTSPKDMSPIEHSNFGKFWQTVRDRPRLELEVNLPGSDLAEKIEMLRSIKPEKGVYGGHGWANYAAAYFNDCKRFAEGMQYSLKRGGKAFIVIGNSILQGIAIQTDRYFAEIAESVGFELVQIDIPRTTRVGNSIIHSDIRVSKARKSDKLYESIVEIRKP